MASLYSGQGVRWLHRLLSLSYCLVVILAVVTAVWLLVSLPVWYPDAPRVPLLGMVMVPAAAWPTLVTAPDAGVSELEIVEVHGILRARFENPWSHWVFLFIFSLGVGLCAVVLFLLLRIVGSIADRDVFTRANARRLRWLGLALVVEAVASPVAVYAMSRLAIGGVTVAGAPFAVDWKSEFDWTSFVGAWIVLILSEVFRQGADLRDDQSLTV